MEFQYTTKTKQGGMTTGVISAGTQKLAREELRRQGVFVVSLKRTGGAVQQTLTAVMRSRGKVSRRDLLNLTMQFAIMTRAGIDVAAAIKSLSEQCQNPHLRTILRQIHADVNSGTKLSDALKKHSTFSTMFVAMIAAGESAGRLPEILQRLGELQRSELRNRGILRSLLAYPIVLASVSLLVVAAMVCFVLPQFADIFEDANVPLPALTQFLMATTEALKNYLYFWIPGLVLTFAGIISYFRSENGQRLWHQIQLNGMLLRNVTQTLLVGRAFRLLGMMIQSGVPLLDGINLTRRSIQNILYQELFEKLEHDILNGRKLGPSLLDAGFIPPTATEMIITAETTGTMGAVTQMMGEHFEEEGQERLRELTAILEPAIIIAMGVIVGTLVIAIMLPMFDMATLSNAN